MLTQGWVAEVSNIYASSNHATEYYANGIQMKLINKLLESVSSKTQLKNTKKNSFDFPLLHGVRDTEVDVFGSKSPNRYSPCSTKSFKQSKLNKACFSSGQTYFSPVTSYSSSPAAECCLSLHQSWASSSSHRKQCRGQCSTRWRMRQKSSRKIFSWFAQFLYLRQKPSDNFGPKTIKTVFWLISCLVSLGYRMCRGTHNTIMCSMMVGINEQTGKQHWTVSSKSIHPLSILSVLLLYNLKIIRKFSKT